MSAILRWFKSFDRCQFGHVIWTHGGYTLCRKHEEWTKHANDMLYGEDMG